MRLAMVLLAMWFWAACPPGGRAEMLYRFVDQQGTVHYSNAPVDRRYRSAGGWPSGCGRSGDYAEIIDAAAARFGLDPDLIRAVIAVESGYDELALSRKGAMGLMQLMPETARDLQVSEPYDPGQNIFGGARYLRRMLKRFGGDLELALAAYNAGPERVWKAGGLPAIPETTEYVKRVLETYRRTSTGSLAGGIRSWVAGPAE